MSQEDAALGRRKGDPEPVIHFEAGPVLSDRAALASWLEANKERRLRLPIMIELGADGSRSARVGTVALRLTDLSLGIPLKERMAQRCGRDAQRCALWLEGRYGQSLPRTSPGDPPQFEVLKVGDVVDEQTELRAERAK